MLILLLTGLGLMVLNCNVTGVLHLLLLLMRPSCLLFMDAPILVGLLLAMVAHRGCCIVLLFNDVLLMLSLLLLSVFGRVVALASSWCMIY